MERLPENYVPSLLTLVVYISSNDAIEVEALLSLYTTISFIDYMPHPFRILKTLLEPKETVFWYASPVLLLTSQISNALTSLH